MNEYLDIEEFLEQQFCIKTREFTFGKVRLELMTLTASLKENLEACVDELEWKQTAANYSIVFQGERAIEHVDYSTDKMNKLWSWDVDGVPENLLDLVVGAVTEMSAISIPEFEPEVVESEDDDDSELKADEQLP